VFDRVVQHNVGDTFAVPEPSVVSRYCASFPPESVDLHDGPQWREVLAAVDQLIAIRFAADGAFRVTGRATVLIGQ
jgi:hypothetical protein